MAHLLRRQWGGFRPSLPDVAGQLAAPRREVLPEEHPLPIGRLLDVCWGPPGRLAVLLVPLRDTPGAIIGLHVHVPGGPVGRERQHVGGGDVRGEVLRGHVAAEVVAHVRGCVGGVLGPNGPLGVPDGRGQAADQLSPLSARRHPAGPLPLLPPARPQQPRLRAQLRAHAGHGRLAPPLGFRAPLPLWETHGESEAALYQHCTPSLSKNVLEIYEGVLSKILPTW